MSPLCLSTCSCSATSFRRLQLAAAMADTEAVRGESTACGVVVLVRRVGCARDVGDAPVRSGSSGVRGTCGAPRDTRCVSPAEKELGVCRWSRDVARCDRRRCARSGLRAGSRS